MTNKSSEVRLREILRKVTLDGGLPPREALALTGVDLEILDRVFESWRQHRDYLRGYEDFDSLFNQRFTNLDDHFVFNTSGLQGKYRQALVLLEGTIMRPKQWSNGHVAPSWHLTLTEKQKTERERNASRSYRNGYFMIILTRDCEWIIYTNYPNREFCVAKSPEDAVRLTLGAIPEDACLGSKGSSVKIPSLALEIANELEWALNRSIQRKESDLECELPTLKHIKELMGTFSRR